MIHMSSCVLGETKSSVENILTRLTCLSSVIWFRIAVVVDHVLATTVPALINR
jgi:preprotein translocase subunit SecG